MEAKNLNLTTEQAIQEFYDRHDFGEDGGVNEKYAWIRFGFISIPIPNIESRKNNVYLHDVSHVVTGHDTTWKGESAVINDINKDLTDRHKTVASNLKELISNLEFLQNDSFIRRK